MTELFIAAGGGGDPVGAALIHASLGGRADAVVLTYGWERLTVDPVPGPAAPHDFTGLDHDTLPVPLVTPAAEPVEPRGSTLPRLAGRLPTKLALLDPYTGVEGLADQIGRTARAMGADHISVVDMGGDILAHGDEPTLASPLLDALALAACHLAGIHTTVHVAGPGLDGEIPEATLLTRVTGDGTALDPAIPGWAADILRWHPSEASALLAAAAAGLRGPCLTRQDAGPIPLTDRSGRVWDLPLAQALDHNRLAQGLLDTRPDTLAGAEDVSLKLHGFSEYERERGRAVHRPSARDVIDDETLVGELDGWLQAQSAGNPGARYVSVRCAVESLGYDWRLTEHVRDLLTRHRPGLDAFPLLSLTD
ncbi:hypothetical protein C3489_05845 [Streptomyces sp. Ru71]|uniref:DUF1152 domain-containing protein n=1 Tax=Streptomyces sp. Ru71 TaxID=2080746 RepID=UPI000CDDAE27|nr:DUF1152 domain-containing protein [Streptomyces sp. Ru71]POX56244.1 hypothetical protein C3489_05845 [Streptomyces sp. Ru71]